MQPILRDHDVRYYRNRGREESGVFCILEDDDALRVGLEYKAQRRSEFYYHCSKRETRSLSEALGAFYLLYRAARVQDIVFKVESDAKVHISFPFSSKLIYNHALEVASGVIAGSKETSVPKTHFSLLLPRTKPIDEVLGEIIFPRSDYRYVHDYCFALGSMTKVVVDYGELDLFFQHNETVIRSVISSLPENVRERFQLRQEEIVSDPTGVKTTYRSLRNDVERLMARVRGELGDNTGFVALERAFGYLNPRFVGNVHNGGTQELKAGLAQLATLCFELDVYSPQFREYGTQGVNLVDLL